MKICPNCQRTYTDDGLNFCLDDGGVLSSVNSSAPPPTVFMGEPRPTNPNQGFGNEIPTQQNWNNPAPHSMQPKKSSKTWIWAVGILGLVVLLCGGGLVGFIAYVGSLDTNTNAINGSNTGASNANVVGNTPLPNERTNVEKLDLAKWVIKESEFGVTEYNSDVLTMYSRKKGFYYVIAGTSKEKTENATSKVTVKNSESADSTLGFGLVVHSQTTPLKQGYAFLIDSEKKKYRVVYHEPGKETATVNWTNSFSIKDGTAENNLEVRDKDGKMDFYINGDLITSVRNVYGYKGGVIGIYSGDAVKIAFLNLEIRR